MSDRMCGCITIGGRLERSKVPELLGEIAEARVSLEWGDAHFAPEAVEDLRDALKNGRLWLCYDQASYGEFPELEAACQVLGLAFCRHSEARYEHSAELVDFRPGMAEPLVRVGDNSDEQAAYVPERSVREALALLEEGHAADAVKALRDLCPDLPEIPTFEVV